MEICRFEIKYFVGFDVYRLETLWVWLVWMSAFNSVKTISLVAILNISSQDSVRVVQIYFIPVIKVYVKFAWMTFSV